MNNENREVGMARREFLRRAGAAGAGAAGVALAAGAVEAAVADEAPATDGYRETAHVRRYYQLARS